MSLQLVRITQASLVASLLILLTPFAHAGETPNQEAQTILHMLDYVSVDYGGAVQQGKVLNEDEFKEQAEFSDQVIKLLGRLPEHPRRAGLVAEALELSRNVRTKAPAEKVSASAQQLRRSIIGTYQVSVSPRRVPELGQAIALYQQLCVSCHGAKGHGDGVVGQTLDPKPANFHDAARMNQRSVYGLYNTITLGVAGTAMSGFPQLSDDERWALAFLTSNFRTSTELLDQGRKLWEKRDYQVTAPDLVTLTTLTDNEIDSRFDKQTKKVFTYLRAEPKTLESARHATLFFASEQLDLALSHYRNGDNIGAQRFAIAAYLEGFDPIEPSLDNLDSQLRLNIEHAMMSVRQLISSGAAAETVASKVELAHDLLLQADQLLKVGKLSVAGAFASAFFILLREGLEAILVLAAVIAFVIKSGRREALVYIHAGWGGALLLGGITWATATWLVDISGANREITSGVTALIASAMLIYVGFWLHDKTHAQSWQKFLREQVGAALEKKTLGAFALISFFAVYREIFETVLFYQALWSQTAGSTRSALWSGILTAALMLLATGWGLFRFGIRLPLAPFFSSMSILLAILAVIFAGQGIAALQEAGVVATSAVNFISLPMLGVFPTAQTLLVQALVIGILLLCFHIPGWRQRLNPVDSPPTPRT
jgi:high-affinity iron transporter